MESPPAAAAATSTSGNRRQKRMGPAPFASFEDLSDEVRASLESPEDKTKLAGSVVRLPGIREDATPTTPSRHDRSPSPAFPPGISLLGVVAGPPSGHPTTPGQPTTSPRATIRPPATPRIDISRASSSSHHDSRDSTPEREIFEGKNGDAGKLGLGFREEGSSERGVDSQVTQSTQEVGCALDLRSSTEELDFQDPEERKSRTRAPSPASVHDECCPADHRKDSQCSDIVLLSISGRTSRLSSIGSQGSAQSRVSNASHLSVMSGQSRCSSPHKTLLETSFCGTKPPEVSQNATEEQGVKVEELEKLLLSRKHDPTEAVLAEGIKIEQKKKEPPPEKPARKEPPVKITVEKVESVEQQLPKKIISQSGVEYIYIPLKGPLPQDNEATTSRLPKREVKSASLHQKPSPSTSKPGKSSTKSVGASPSIQEPKYIRIKLKPDHCYEDGDDTIQKPDSLELKREKQPYHDIQVQKNENTRSLSNTPSASPKLARRKHDSNIDSVSPSPSISRRSSFASLFRSKEAIISPESPTVPGHKRKNTITGILRDASESIKERSRSRSRSKSRERDKSLSTAPSSTESIDVKSKHKSVLSIFKASKKDRKGDDSSSHETLPSIDGIGKVEFKFNDTGTSIPKKQYYESPLAGESVRIPLHSPTYYEDKNVLQDWKTSSQDSQETVIEASSRKNVNVVVEPIPQIEECKVKKPQQQTSRQSSTSSENVVFSTKLGNDNEVFTTKISKKQIIKQTEKVQMNGDAINKVIPEEKKEEIVEQKINSPEKKMIVKDEKVPLPKTKSTNSIQEETKMLKDKRISQLSAASSRNSYLEEEHYSSESERDSEVDYPRLKKEQLELKLDLESSEPERKAIVFQDSFEDELPYVPTTLPLERSAAVPIVPIKQRSTFEMKTCPIERPRSTTPINPSCLEEYCEEVMGTFDFDSVTKTIEKLKISLPRNDSFSKLKSPRKSSNSTNWQAFAEKNSTHTTPRSSTGDTPPPLPPKGVQKTWINFEEIPEKRKAPKRIQTIPSLGHIEVPESVLQEHVVYNYVNPEDCRCECHEQNAKERDRRKQEVPPEKVNTRPSVQEDELPLLDEDNPEEEKSLEQDKRKLDVAVSDCRSVISDSSVDLSTVDANATGVEASLRTPFTSDLGLNSNRSSIVSQEELRSPGSPNAFPKVS